MNWATTGGFPAKRVHAVCFVRDEGGRTREESGPMDAVLVPLNQIVGSAALLIPNAPSRLIFPLWRDGVWA